MPKEMGEAGEGTCCPCRPVTNVKSRNSLLKNGQVSVVLVWVGELCVCVCVSSAAPQALTSLLAASLVRGGGGDAGEAAALLNTRWSCSRYLPRLLLSR